MQKLNYICIVACLQLNSDMEGSTADGEEVSADAPAHDDSDLVEDGESASVSQEPSFPPKKEVSLKSGKKKKKAACTRIPSEVKCLTEMASSATKVLESIGKNKSTAEAHIEDSDWNFCTFIYHKMKSIPDGDLKDEMQMQMQSLLCATKRQCTTGDMEKNATCVTATNLYGSNMEGNANAVPYTYLRQNWSETSTSTSFPAINFQHMIPRNSNSEAYVANYAGDNYQSMIPMPGDAAGTFSYTSL